MKKITAILLFTLIAFTAMAQQLPPYDRTRSNQVMDDRATWSRYFMSVPHGPTPFFPTYVPDSLKCGALFYKTASGDTSLYVYNCLNSTWQKVGGASSWGTIAGTLSAQTDLQAALNAKEGLTNKASGFGTLNNTLYPTTQAVANYITSFGYLTNNFYNADGTISGNRLVTLPVGKTLDITDNIITPHVQLHMVSDATNPQISLSTQSGSSINNSYISLQSAFLSMTYFNASGFSTTFSIGLLGHNVFTDGIGAKGIVYGGDYSANFTARSLIDKGYADATYAPVSGGSSYAPISGSVNYIQNGTSPQSSSNFNISGNGIAAQFSTNLLQVTGSGITSDGMGAINNTQSATGNHAYFGMTRSGNVAWGQGISTSNDMIWGTSASRGATGLIDTIKAKLTLAGNFTTIGFVQGSGFQIPGGTGSILLDNNTVATLDGSTIHMVSNVISVIGGGGSSFYQTVQANTTSKTQRAKLNFSTKFSATDNSGNGSTDIDITSVPWSALTGTPTTLGGYGVTSVAWSALTGTPTTLGGYGVTAVAWSALTSTPTTLSGYGITDGLTASGIAALSHKDLTDATNTFPNFLYSYNTQTSSYTLVLGDGKLTWVQMNSSSANNLTVPSNSSVAYAIGTTIPFTQIGTGQTTVVPASGVTLNAAGGAVALTQQYSSGLLTKTGTNTWTLTGDTQ